MSERSPNSSAARSRWLPLGIAAAVFVLAAAFLVWVAGGSDNSTDSPDYAPPSATPAPLDLIALHTNDTWGYLYPCG